MVSRDYMLWNDNIYIFQNNTIYCIRNICKIYTSILCRPIFKSKVFGSKPDKKTDNTTGEEGMHVYNIIIHAVY